MKKISILIPCLNEVNNIELVTDAVISVFEKELTNYDYELIFIDNYSTDGTREKLRLICKGSRKIKAIFNTKNFGPSKSPAYGMIQTKGDCVITLPADLQVPPSCIPEFIKKWEEGYKVVASVKSKSRDNPIMIFFRYIYYKLFNLLGETEHIEHFTGFGLYDREFVNILATLEEPEPYIRGLVTEFESRWTVVEYTEPKRKYGHTKTNFFSLYDTAMLGFTSYSKAIPRYATLLGFIISGICILIAIVYLILKIIYWDTFPMGVAPIIISLFFLSGIQLFFIGFIGEYILRINTRVAKRPLVIEEERINFSEEDF